MAELKRVLEKPAQQRLDLPNKRVTETPESIKASAVSRTTGAIQSLMEAQKHLRRLDAEKVRLEKTNQMRDIIRGIEDTEKQRKGSAADGATERGRLEYQTAMGELMSGANPDHAEALKASLESQADSSLNSLAVHERGQKDVAIAAETDRFIDASYNTVLNDPIRWFGEQGERAKLKAEFDGLRGVYGPEIVDKLIDEATSKVITGALEGDVRQRVARAMGTGEDLKSVKSGLATAWAEEWTAEQREDAFKFADTQYAHEKRLTRAAKIEGQNEIIADIYLSNDIEKARAALKNPLISNDPGAVSDVQRYMTNLTKQVKQEQKDAEFRQAQRKLTDPDADPELTPTELVKGVTDVGDAKSLIQYQKALNAMPLVRKTSFDRVLTNFERDYKDTGVFGDFGTLEAETEYMRQVRAFQEWTVTNTEGDPIEYYGRIMEPKEAGAFAKRLDYASGGLLGFIFGIGTGDADPEAARLEIEAETRQRRQSRQERRKGRQTRDNWIKRAIPQNPEWTEEELGKEYDKIYGGG